MTSGVKRDAGKLRLDLIPPEMHRTLGEVLTFGASKYDDHNWEKGLDSERLYAACQRHLLAHREGKKPWTRKAACPTWSMPSAISV